jgi:hypothetical protein
MPTTTAPAPLPNARRRWLAPLIFVQVYLSLTVWLFFYGPWPWEVDNRGELFAFLVAAQVAIAAGYLLAWRRVRDVLAAPPSREGMDAGVRFLKLALLLTFAMAIPTSLSRTGSWIPNVAAGLANAGEVYADAQDRLEFGNPYIAVEYLRMLLSPWLTALFPLTVVYWGRIGAGLRLLAVAAVAFNLSLYLATGTNKGFADMVITFPWLISAAVASGALRIRKFGLKVGASTALIFLAFLVFFVQGQQQRSGSGTEYGTFFTGAAVLQSDSDNFISSLLPDELRLAYEALSRYVVQGYYALSLGLQSHSPSTLGLGNSMFLARNADQIFGGTFFVNMSLPGVIERDHGWGMFQLWHSIYPWIASDIGFPATLVMMGVFAYLLGLAWGRTLAHTHPAWVVLLFMLLILFYYVPANNQIFQAGESCIGFLMLLAMALAAGPSRRMSRLQAQPG